MVSLQQYDYMLKVAQIGNSRIGKSSILLRYTDDVFNSSQQSTLGIYFKTKTIETLQKQIKFVICDTAGQEKFGTISEEYYRGANQIIIVFDLTDKSSFEEASQWLDQVNQYKQKGDKIYLVGNKLDLSSQRCATYEEAKNFANQNSLSYFETSAKQGKCINELFACISEDFIKSQAESQSSKKRSPRKAFIRMYTDLHFNLDYKDIKFSYFYISQFISALQVLYLYINYFYQFTIFEYLYPIILKRPK